MFGSKSKKYTKELLEIVDDLFEHVWDHANFRNDQYVNLDQNEKRIGTNCVVDPVIAKHWQKYHDLHSKFCELKRKIN